MRKGSKKEYAYRCGAEARRVEKRIDEKIRLNQTVGLALYEQAAAAFAKAQRDAYAVGVKAYAREYGNKADMYKQEAEKISSNYFQDISKDFSGDNDPD